MSIWATVASVVIPARDPYGDDEPGPATTIDVSNTAGYRCEVRLSLYRGTGEGETVYLTLDELTELANVLAVLVAAHRP
jgi:hypothetical protein